MSIANEVQRILNAKSSIKTAIENKGVEVGNGTLDTYAEKINEIKTGGDFDWSQIRRTSNLFYGNTEMVEAPYFDMSTVEQAGSMFNGCTNLEKTPPYNTPNLTSVNAMYSGCKKLKEIGILDTSKCTNFFSFVMNCSSLINFPELDTSSATDIRQMCVGCSNLETIPLLDFGSITTVQNAFGSTPKLTNLRGFKDLGKAYTQKSNNYTPYDLTITSNNLTHESLMNVINNLYDLNIAYDVANGGTLYTQQLTIQKDNLAKLTPEEIAIATNKGWTVG